MLPSEGTQRCDRSNSRREFWQPRETDSGRLPRHGIARETLFSQVETSKHTFHFSYLGAGDRIVCTPPEEDPEGRERRDTPATGAFYEPVGGDCRGAS